MTETRRGWLRAVGAVGVTTGAAALGGCGVDQASPPRTSAEPTVGPASTTPAAIPGSGIVTGPFSGEAKSLTGAGATFPAALYSKWFAEYHRLTGVEVNYQSIGSGGGIKAIQDMTADFGATDGAMTDAQLKDARGGEILHVPVALGAVVATYNLPELPAGAKLRFSPETLAAIFLGEIKKWSDARIRSDNPTVTALPDKEITPVFRSDSSGTTSIFTDYLSNVSPAWKERVGSSTAVSFPVGLGGKGNEGVAGEVKQNPYSLGYVELIYAKQNKLGYAQVKNREGQFVEPELDSVTAAAQGVIGRIAPDLRASIVNAEGPKSYPISGFTWILAYREMKEEPKAVALSRLLWWATHDAQRFNGDLGYAPLPAELIGRAEEMIRSMTVNGKPAFPEK
ncbi:MAG TPA: phosphate ABC transporter substrate-binding protein PstS [Chloroflexota bacterium]|nr:phosphate ABC transporter substrate-binding protein PstS [Chloroflexota bacterium]